MIKKIVVEVFSCKKYALIPNRDGKNKAFLSVGFQVKQIISLKKSMKLMEKKIYLYDEFFRLEI